MRQSAGERGGCGLIRGLTLPEKGSSVMVGGVGGGFISPESGGDDMFTIFQMSVV